MRQTVLVLIGPLLVLWLAVLPETPVHLILLTNRRTLSVLKATVVRRRRRKRCYTTTRKVSNWAALFRAVSHDTAPVIGMSILRCRSHSRYKTFPKESGTAMQPRWMRSCRHSMHTQAWPPVAALKQTQPRLLSFAVCSRKNVNDGLSLSRGLSDRRYSTNGVSTDLPPIRAFQNFSFRAPQISNVGFYYALETKKYEARRLEKGYH